MDCEEVLIKDESGKVKLVEATMNAATIEDLYVLQPGIVRSLGLTLRELSGCGGLLLWGSGSSWWVRRWLPVFLVLSSLSVGSADCQPADSSIRAATNFKKNRFTIIAKLNFKVLKL